MQLISNKYKTFIINRLAEISGLIFLSFSILLFFILFSYSPLDPSINNVTDQEAQNILGSTGATFADLLIQIFGTSSYIIIIFFLTWSYKLTIFKKLPFFLINFLSGIISLLTIDLIFLIYKINILHGFISLEIFNNIIDPIIKENYIYFEVFFVFILSLLFLIFFVLSCALDKNEWQKIFLFIWLSCKFLLNKSLKFLKFSFNKKKDVIFEKNKIYNLLMEEKIEPKINFDSIKNENVSSYITNNKNSSELVQKKMSFNEDTNYIPPIIDILSSPKASSISLVTKEEIESNAIKLKEVLADFKIEGEIINVSPGPVVTMYELQPAPGTKASKIIGL